PATGPNSRPPASSSQATDTKRTYRAAIPDIGALSNRPATPPAKSAPKENKPPSAAAIQYPFPSGSAAMPTMGALGSMSESGNEPRNRAEPNANAPPSFPAIPEPRPP